VRCLVASVLLALFLPTAASGAAPGKAKHSARQHKKGAPHLTPQPAAPLAAPVPSAEPAPIVRAADPATLGGGVASPAAEVEADSHAAPISASVVRPAPAAVVSPATAMPSFDFDLLDAPPAALAAVPDPAFDARVQRRRFMLQLHQGLGGATWLALAATEIVGQLNFNDKYRGGGDTGRYYYLHLGLASTATALFVSVGLLGVLAPEPFEKHAGFDTATMHKLFMALATLGMLTEVGLGVYTKSREGHLEQRDLARLHQTVGYTTWGAMTLGVVSLMF